jgi:PKD repeat protein
VDLEGAATQAPELAFWCAGSYQVSLTVTDSTGVASLPATRTLVVTAAANPPTVTASAALAVDHACAGSPLQCGLAAPVAISASGHSPLGLALGYQWVALPPDPTRAPATQLFSPSSASQAPTLDLRTDGGPLSGSWRLRVRVTDPQGYLAQALVPLTVHNRPPAIAVPPLSVDHQWQSGSYRVAAAVALPVSDPDGDPLTTSALLEEPRERSPPEVGAGREGSSRWPAPAAGLMAPDLAQLGVLRQRPAASADLAVEVRNRVPVLRPTAGAGVTALAVDHQVGACPDGLGRCFLATAVAPFVAEDPDGDPVASITLSPSVEASRSSSGAEVITSTPGGAVRFSTPVAKPLEFRSASGAGGFRIMATATDTFGASLPIELPVVILNRPPTVSAPVSAAAVAHRFDAAARSYQADATLSAFFDPDGDPMAAVAGAEGDDCGAISLSELGVASVACRRTAPPGATYPLLAGFAGSHQVVAAVSDGWESATATTALTVSNQPPSVPAFDGSAESCACVCTQWEVGAPTVCAVEPRWVTDLTGVPFPARPLDADGDLLIASFSPSAGLGAASVVEPPDACTTTFSAASVPFSVQVTVNDGVSQATGTWKINAVVCGKAGQVCTTPRPKVQVR